MFRLCLILVLPIFAQAGEWQHYGGDAGGQRYVSLEQITPNNVSELEIAWQFNTGDKGTKPLDEMALEVTPILVEDSLVFCTPFNRIIAIDPGTGKQKWQYDVNLSLDIDPANQFVCRGVTYWQDAMATPETKCSSRIFMATNDTRLVSVDAKTGEACAGFSDHEDNTSRPGEINVGAKVELYWPGEYQMTSPPVVLNDVVIIGSAISDNARVEAPAGVVKAFDARTGKPLWQFDPVPRNPEDAKNQDWKPGYNVKTGAANVWAPMSIDEGRNLVFLPTSSPSPDFYAATRPGNNQYANSVVALNGTTGKVVWSFQTVHHDVWDYDLPAQPSLITLERDGKPVDVVAQVTKTGFMFVLERDTGKPFFGVEEKPVPQSAEHGELLSPTQPFPIKPPALVPQHLTRDDVGGFALIDGYLCKQAFDQFRSEGLFTPPSKQGTVLYPFTGGGANWGGMAFDPTRKIAVVNMSRAVHVITLFKSDEYKDMRKVFHDTEVSPQHGAEYGMKRDLMLSIFGAPCNKPPWGELIGVDLNTGDIAWRQTLGTTEGLIGVPLKWGTPNFGGPLTTASGLIFIGAAMDDYLRAFDTETGEELWKGDIPAGGQATPMSYEWQGRQYVLIAAGGHARSGTTLGDHIVAFALPD
tara:strand:+ start:4557 stop:6476 length:1920 start_codon:yes stop_codon:yes gene_type:complete